MSTITIFRSGTVTPEIIETIEIARPPPTADDVRAEASRRMQAAFGARDAVHLGIIIENATREVARLNQVRAGVPHPETGWIVEPREWTPAERARLAELHAADQLFEAIRAASNAMEGAPPEKFADDAHWPAMPA